MPEKDNTNQSLKIIKKNLTYLYASEAIIRILTLILTIILARAYGPVGFGVYTLSLSVAGLLDIIFQMGLTTVYIQRVAARHEDEAAQNGIFLPLKILLCILSFGCIFIFVVFLNKDFGTSLALILAALYTSISSICLFLWTVFDAKQKMQYTAASKLVEFGIFFIIGIFIILDKQPIQYIFVAYIIAIVITTFVTIAIITRKFSRIKLNFKPAEWLSIIKQGYPITLSGAFIYVYNYLDTIILSKMKGEALVGTYQVSYKIIGTLFLISAIINQAYLPSLVETKEKNADNLDKIFSNAMQNVFFWSLPITLGATVLADKIILVVFGSQYLSGVTTFKILIWNCIIYFLSSAFTNLLYAVKQQHKTMKIFFVGAFLNVTFNLFVIPLYGIEGAALTTVLAEFVVLIGMYMLARKIVKIRIISSAAPSLIASLIMFSALYLIKIDSVFLAILVGALVYFGVFFIIKGIPVNYIFNQKIKKIITPYEEPHF